MVLIAPDGTRYTLKAAQKKDTAPNVNATYTVNLGSEALNGTWKLEVSDTMRNKTGTLNAGRSSSRKHSGPVPLFPHAREKEPAPFFCGRGAGKMRLILI